MGVEYNYGLNLLEHEKQYSLQYYAWMMRRDNVGVGQLSNIIKSDTFRWAAEHVFRTGYQEFWYEMKGGKLVSPDFGGRTMTSMCEEAVVIRSQAGVSLERVEHEREGIYELEGLLSVVEVGQTVLLVSPPDETDYNMLYVYEKQVDGRVRATAIRDEISSMEDLRVLSGYLSGVSSRWKGMDHLGFVATPFVTQLSYDELVGELGVSERDELPDWVEGMVSGVVPAMIGELSAGNVDGAVRVFDAFQMAVFAQKEIGEKNVGMEREVNVIDPMAMMGSEVEWMMVQGLFLIHGGMDMVEAGGQCGMGSIGLEGDRIGESNNVLSSLMNVDESKPSEEYSFDKEGDCVVCKKHSDSVGRLGPCKICKGCDHKLQSAGGE